jgi:DNA-binding GntR family transcriptional regulator
MRELSAIRSTIEGFAIRRTAQKITPEQCHELEELVQQMEEAGREQALMTLAQHDMQFHRLIVEWSESAGLLRVWTPLSSQIQRFIVQSHPAHYSDFVEIGSRHQVIVDALRRHDGDEAVRSIQEHVMHIWSRIPF